MGRPRKDGTPAQTRPNKRFELEILRDGSIMVHLIGISLPDAVKMWSETGR